MNSSLGGTKLDNRFENYIRQLIFKASISSFYCDCYKIK